MNATMQKAAATAPANTTGLVIEPWGRGETYGVAADWAQASACVYAYGDREWIGTGRQVADYRHDPRAALVDVLAESLRMSGDDEADAETLADDAKSFWSDEDYAGITGS